MLVELKCASGVVPFYCYAKQKTSWTKIMAFEVLGEKLDILVLSGDRISHFDMVRTSASTCVSGPQPAPVVLYSLPTHRGIQFILGI